MGWLTRLACAAIALVTLYKLFFEKGGRNQTLSKTQSRLNKDLTPSFETTDVTQQESIKRPSFTFTDPVLAPSTMIEQAPNIGQNQYQLSTNSTNAPTMPPPSLPQIVSKAAASDGLSPQSNSPPRLKPPKIGPAPPRPGGSTLMPPPSAAASLRVPQQEVLKNTSMQPSSLKPATNKPSRQVILEPGHSPLDWAALTSNPNNSLRGKDLPSHLIKVTPSQLKLHNGRKGKDAWTVYQGKVYNITPYVPFHPGGKGEILRGAAKDSVKLFMEVHPWVNWDGMLGECLVGILGGEDDGEDSNKLDEVD